jgi:zinc protease
MRPDQNRADLLLLKELLNGQSGRLFEALRNKRSLCYNTGIQSTAGFGPGMIAAFVLTDPAREEEALSALLNELEAVAHAEAAPSEFERARAKLTGNLLITSQSNAARVHRCARDVMYDRDPNNLPNLLDQIAACTPRTVRDTAELYFSVPQRFEIISGPGENHGE